MPESRQKTSAAAHDAPASETKHSRPTAPIPVSRLGKWLLPVSRLGKWLLPDSRLGKWLLFTRDGTQCDSDSVRLWLPGAIRDSEPTLPVRPRRTIPAPPDSVLWRHLSSYGTFPLTFASLSHRRDAGRPHFRFALSPQGRWKASSSRRPLSSCPHTQCVCVCVRVCVCMEGLVVQEALELLPTHTLCVCVCVCVCVCAWKASSSRRPLSSCP